MNYDNNRFANEYTIMSIGFSWKLSGQLNFLSEAQFAHFLHEWYPQYDISVEIM